MGKFANIRLDWRRCATAAAMFAPLALLGSQATAQTLTPGQAHLSGVWQITKPVFQVRTTDGNTPPLKPEAAKIYQEHIAQRKAGDTSFDSATWCAGVGIPRLMFINYPFEIIAHPAHVAFLYEWNEWDRSVDMSGKAPAVPVPAGPGFGDQETDATVAAANPGSMGAPAGHWDGDTLVIDTDGILDTTLIDSAGIPHGDNLKVTERLKLLSPDVLQDVVRIDDPDTFTAPWETTVTYKRQHGAAIKEDVCLDRIKYGAPAIKE